MYTFCPKYLAKHIYFIILISLPIENVNLFESVYGLWEAD